MRKASIKRTTKETDVEVAVDLDGTGASSIATGIGFFDHMLDLLARHSRIDLTVKAKGDLHIDHHHTTEDVGIALGQAVKQALGDMRGITRYADVHVPMDEALTRVAIDISGRPFLVFKAEFVRDKVGTFDTELVQEWFQAFATNAGVTLHVQVLYGTNDHHIAESCFKGLARALRAAISIDARAANEIPSTKGSLGGMSRLRSGRLIAMERQSVMLRQQQQVSGNAMAVYTVHQPPLKKYEAAPDPERFAFVRDGFSFWAFLFGPLWMLRHRMWLVLLGYIVVAVAMHVGLRLVGASSGGSAVRGVHAGAADRHGGGNAAALHARPPAAGAMSARSSATIARRSSGGSSIRGCAARRWRRSRRVTPHAAPPAAPAQRGASPAPDVIGLFPQPGAHR